MIELKPRAEASVFWTYASPVLALLLTVCIGLGIFVALGKDPHPRATGVFLGAD